MKNFWVSMTLILGIGAVTVATYRPANGQAAETGSRVQIGWSIAPVPLKTEGKNLSQVALGSYLVNAVAGCNDCHTWPNYATKNPDGSCNPTQGNPYLGQPEQINQCRYLAGGRPFPTPMGTFISPNITPDENGLPAGLTYDEFHTLIATGHDPRDLNSPNSKLQVMPWPVYRNMTEHDLKAIYEYLTTIPSFPGNR